MKYGRFAVVGLVCGYLGACAAYAPAPVQVERKHAEDAGAALTAEADAASDRGDYSAALRLYRDAAERGDTEAQASLGTMSFLGNGVSKDYAEAASWYRKSAERGNGNGQTLLAFMYHSGAGVPQDYVQAVAWYRKAAERGFSLAQAGLGVCYFVGQGVTEDLVQAYKWLNLAAASVQDATPAARAVTQLDRERIAEARDKVAALMTPRQIAEAQKLAREWKPKAQ